MDAKLKADWVKALRSGEYRQTAGQFELDGKFCALGVLCRVLGEPATRVDDFGPINNWRVIYPHLTHAQYTRVYSVNDNGCSFAEVASYIEARIPAEHRTDISSLKALLVTEKVNG